MVVETQQSQRETPHAHRAVLHLVGRLTDTVFSFLGPVTATLAQQGARQTVVLIDDPLHRHLLPKFHESIRLVLTDGKVASGGRLNALLDAYCDAADSTRPSVAHLHGMVCLLLGVYASHWRGVCVPTYFSPHGSKLLGPLAGIGRAVLWTLRPIFGDRAQPTIVNSSVDARSLQSVTQRSVHLIESPVADSFFGEDATPSEHPQIVSSGRVPNPLGAAQYAQCAVVFADQVPGLKFVWMGAADPESAARLKAAGVSVQELSDDDARATRLAQSWVYVAPGGGLGFPVFMAEAMALGLPCVAWDTPYHRDIIEDDVTGFICRDMYEVLARLTELLESASLRARIGKAARACARVRFDGGRFQDSLLELYDSAVVEQHSIDPDDVSMPAGWKTSTVPAALTELAFDGLGSSSPGLPQHQPEPGAVRTTLARMALPVVTAAAGMAFGSRVRTRRQKKEMVITVLSRNGLADLEGVFGLTSASRIETLLAEHRSGRTSVVVIGTPDRPVGIAAIRWSGPHDDAIRAAVPACPEIHSVEVDAGFRSTGVGSRLLAFCEGWALERRFRYVGASVSLSNVHAYALYLRLGYVDPMIVDDLGRNRVGLTTARPIYRFMIKALE